EHRSESLPLARAPGEEGARARGEKVAAGFSRPSARNPGIESLLRFDRIAAGSRRSPAGHFLLRPSLAMSGSRTPRLGLRASARPASAEARSTKICAVLPFGSISATICPLL